MLNGRFATQPLTGVQRFSLEITAELELLLGARLRILTPRGGTSVLKSAREFGKADGHKWEQFELPWAAKGGMLINLGNTAPLVRRRQLLVIHDAGVFEAPEAYSRQFRGWYRAMQYWLARNGTRIVTVSLAARGDIARHLRVSPDRIGVIPEGADHMDRVAQDDGCLARFGLEKRRYVLAVGNLAAHKNLRALSALADMLPALGLKLAIAGNLKGGAYSKNGLSGLPQPACYLGRVSDAALKALYSHAAAYVFPSRYEGYGLPAAEAMRCGCPVVASDILALRETCGDAALFADPASPGAFARQVARIIGDDTLSASLAATGRARMAGQTWRKAAEKLLTYVDS